MAEAEGNAPIDAELLGWLRLVERALARAPALSEEAEVSEQLADLFDVFHNLPRALCGGDHAELERTERALRAEAERPWAVGLLGEMYSVGASWAKRPAGRDALRRLGYRLYCGLVDARELAYGLPMRLRARDKLARSGLVHQVSQVGELLEICQMMRRDCLLLGGWSVEAEAALDRDWRGLVGRVGPMLSGCCSGANTAPEWWG